MTKFKNIDGIALVDKPPEVTSNRALQQIRHGFQAKKAGHTGTLDPFASGLLVCCLGQSTKVSGLLLDADKTYVAELSLGQATDTADTEGQVIAQAEVPDFSERELLKIFSEFTGEQDQIPPMYSALKQDGQRLYELARAGITVERKARRICIHALELRAWSPQHIEFLVHCAKGTYVRTLGESLAQALGTVGHLRSLRRTRLGPFSLEQARTPAAWEAAAWPTAELLGSDQALQHWPAQHLDETQARYFSHGRNINAESNAACGQEFRVYGPDARFLGCAEHLGEGVFRPKRLFVPGDQG